METETLPDWYWQQNLIEQQEYIMLKIVKESDPLPETNLIITIYGQPGAGKTSTAFTSENVLLIDTDGGAKRSGFRKDSVQVNSWNDISSIKAGDIKDYDTIAIDTVGRTLDFLSEDIIRENPKLGYRGALTLQGYGQLKSRFATWSKQIIMLKKDLVLLAHDKEEKADETLIIRPDIQGGSYNEVFKISDLVGYLHIVNNKRVLSFDPTDKWHGKNQGLASNMLVPNFESNPNFLGDLIASCKNNINKVAIQQKEVTDIITSWKVILSNDLNLKQFNELFEEGKKVDNEVVKKQIKPLFVKTAKNLGFVFDANSASWKESQSDSENTTPEKEKKTAKQKQETNKEQDSSDKNESQYELLP